MGMFDSVMVPCPNCGTRKEFQSKSGPCDLDVFNFEECPPEVLANVNRHSPLRCGQCGTWFQVEPTMNQRVVAVPDGQVAESHKAIWAAQ